MMYRVRHPLVALSQLMDQLVAAVGIVVLLSGCHQGIYDASSLPPELKAPETINPKSIDLSVLARPAPNTNTIQPGDVLEVTISSGAEEMPPQAQTVRVADDGLVHIPLVGRVAIAGLSPERADYAIATASVERGYFRNPNVTVVPKSRRQNNVTVVGAVAQPGTKHLDVSRSDLLNAIIAAGGLAENADTAIEIRKPDSSLLTLQGTQRGLIHPPANATATPPGSMHGELREINLAAPPQMHEDLRLQDGSVIVVKPRAPRIVHVIGLVQKPGQYELPPDRDANVLEAIAMAGGRTLQFADKVRVLRNVPDRDEASVIKVSFGDAKDGGDGNLVLAAGDVISVEETPATFAMQTVQSFFRVGFSAALPGL